MRPVQWRDLSDVDLYSIGQFGALNLAVTFISFCCISVKGYQRCFRFFRRVKYLKSEDRFHRNLEMDSFHILSADSVM